VSLLVLLVAAGIPQLVSAKTLYVRGGKGSSLAPSSLINRAIEEAEEGDVIRVEGGHWTGRVVIDKTLTVVGVGDPVLDGGGRGTVVEITAPGTVLKGFTVRNSGGLLDPEDSGVMVADAPGTVIEDNHIEETLFGIYLKNSPRSVVKGNYVQGKDLPLSDRGDGIRLWYSSDVLVEGNHLYRVRDLVIWFCRNTVVRGNTVEEGRYGLHYMYSDHNLFESNHFSGNTVGAFLMYSNDIRFYHNTFSSNRGRASGFGIGFKDLDNVTAEENLFIDNRVGIYIDNSPRSIDTWNKLRRNVVAYNDIGLSAMTSIRRNVLWDNSFIDNIEHVEVRGGGVLRGNRWYKDGRGNYWSDYVGFDRDGDGIGDVPYVSESLVETLMDRFPVLRHMASSPAARAIEFAAEAFPLMKPEPKFTDPYPLVAPDIPDVFAAETKGKKGNIRLALLSVSLAVASLTPYVALALGGRRRPRRKR